MDRILIYTPVGSIDSTEYFRSLPSNTDCGIRQNWRCTALKAAVTAEMWRRAEKREKHFYILFLNIKEKESKGGPNRKITWKNIFLKKESFFKKNILIFYRLVVCQKIIFYYLVYVLKNEYNFIIKQLIVLFET